MTELVPFQEKRGKKIAQSLTPIEAVTLELKKYFTNSYPTIEFGTEELVPNTKATTLDKQQLSQLPTFNSFVSALVLVTSPATVLDSAIPWTLCRLELPMLLLRIASKGITKTPYLILPKPYQKMIKRVYTSSETFDTLAQFLSSKRRAKKYLRILQKRLGIYSMKKPPFKKASLIALRSKGPQKKST